MDIKRVEELTERIMELGMDESTGDVVHACACVILTIIVGVAPSPEEACNGVQAISNDMKTSIRAIAARPTAH